MQAIARRNIFAMVGCDIEVPKNFRSQFQEMPPVFKNVHVSRDDIGEIMKTFAGQQFFDQTSTNVDR